MQSNDVLPCRAMVHFCAEEWCTRVHSNSVLLCRAMVYYDAEQWCTPLQSNGVLPCRAIVYCRAEQGYTTVQSNGLPSRAMVYYRTEQSLWCTFFLGGGGYSPTHMDTSPLPMKGWLILTFARHSCIWPLSSEGLLVCHTYCDTGHPFIMVISVDP